MVIGSRLSNCLLLMKSLQNKTFHSSIKRSRGHYTLYNTILEYEKRGRNIQKRVKVIKTHEKSIEEMQNDLPISLRYVLKQETLNDSPNNCTETIEEPVEKFQFPFQNNTKIDLPIENNEVEKNKYEIMKLRNELYRSWMMNYDNFDDTTLEDYEGDNINYGTPDPRSKISNIPCGGCGAHLHCKDYSLPGYIPSEIFKNSFQKGAADLTALICQRCYFLKHHNIALEVQVSEDDYPKVLHSISMKKNAVIVLMVDLTDFPCSIWPGIADIFHRMPIVVVGNKVDLLPRDNPKYLDHIRKKLTENVKEFGFGTTKLIDVVLISATTGYGVENLITVLQKTWRFKGDVYLVGCTNVGKSSLFNILIQSDYCKSQAEDLIQRATTSIWPGTTLNLLKFPIAKPNGFKFELRKKRIEELNRLEKFEAQMNKSKLPNLIGRVERSSKDYLKDEAEFSFTMTPSQTATGRTTLGINEKDPVFAMSRWCFDTPGVVQSDQIIHLLTSEELYLTLPKSLIIPQSFCIKPGESLFIAGLARLDFLEGEHSIRVTVFRSENLPVSVCKTEEALEFYEKYLGTKYLQVPCGGEERLKKWPGLTEAKTFNITGINFSYAAKDVVLSNAGWVAICGRTERVYKFKAWTPEKRGVYLRDCLLPQAIRLRGPRIRASPAYEIHRYRKNS